MYKNIKSICTQWRNEITPRKSKNVPTCATSAVQMSQYPRGNKIFTSNSCLIFCLCFSYRTCGMLHMCGSYASPCFDKLYLPFSTESKDSAHYQRAILSTQVWLWCSQTSRIPLARWFALSKWCHQAYQPQPMLLDILYAKYTAVDNSLGKYKYHMLKKHLKPILY